MKIQTSAHTESTPCAEAAGLVELPRPVPTREMENLAISEPGGNRSFKTDAKLLPPRSPRRQLVQGQPNRYDWLVRRLQLHAVRGHFDAKGENIDARNGSFLTLLSVIRRYRDRLLRDVVDRVIPAVKGSGQAATVVQLKRWANRWQLCTPVANGTRHGQRCGDRCCINCWPIEKAKIHERITRALRARSQTAHVHFLRVAYDHRVWDHPHQLLDAGSGLRAVAQSLRAQADRVLRLLGKRARDALVLIEVDKVQGYERFDPVGPVAVAMAATIVFECGRLPGSIYRNPWKVTTVKNEPADVGRELERCLRVPPGLMSLSAEAYLAVRQSLKKVRSVAFRGAWSRKAPCAQPGARSRPEKSNPMPLLSKASGLLLDALDASDDWISAQPAQEIDLPWLSRAIERKPGRLLPIALVESKEQFALDDLLGRQKNVNRLLNAERSRATAPGKCVVWQASDGQMLVCYPAALENGVRFGLGGAGSCVFVQHQNVSYHITPLVSPRFTRLLWHHWRLPWARPGTHPPEHEYPATMDHSHVRALTQPRMQTSGQTVERSAEETRALVQMYRNLGFGRSEMNIDRELGCGLLDASGRRLGGRVLTAAYRRHGQTINSFFGWASGIIGGQYALLRAGGYGVSGVQNGLEFNLYAEGRDRRQTRRRRYRVVLHDDHRLVEFGRNSINPQAVGLIGEVTLVVGGKPLQVYAQKVSGFYHCLSELEPQRWNSKPLLRHDQWFSEAHVRTYRTLKACSAFDDAADALEQELEEGRQLAAIDPLFAQVFARAAPNTLAEIARLRARSSAGTP